MAHRRRLLVVVEAAVPLGPRGIRPRREQSPCGGPAVGCGHPHRAIHDFQPGWDPDRSRTACGLRIGPVDFGATEARGQDRLGCRGGPVGRRRMGSGWRPDGQAFRDLGNGQDERA